MHLCFDSVHVALARALQGFLGGSHLPARRPSASWHADHTGNARSLVTVQKLQAQVFQSFVIAVPAPMPGIAALIWCSLVVWAEQHTGVERDSIQESSSGEWCCASRPEALYMLHGGLPQYCLLGLISLCLTAANPLQIALKRINAWSITQCRLNSSRTLL